MDTEATIRGQMMVRASRYATFAWRADRDKHIRHDRQVDTPDRYTWDESKEIYQANWSEWHGWAHGWNCGVPYFWGGDVALVRGLDFLNGSNELTLGEVLEQGIGSPPVYDAGDISTVDYGTIRWKSGSGVDCSGFISQVWRLGQYFNPTGLRNISRPSKFEDLKPGDMLWQWHHVMLFKQFLTAEKATPGRTRIRVYESAVYCCRVGLTDYELVNNPVDTTEQWRGFLIPTQRVILRRVATWYGKEDQGTDQPPMYVEDEFRGVELTTLSPPDDETGEQQVISALSTHDQQANGYFGIYESAYQPRAYFTRVDIVLVIDRSGSMSRERKLVEAKQAARLFVDEMRPGDKIGVVAFDSDAFLVYPLTEIDLEGNVKSSARNEIRALETTTANTSIAAGLDEGFEQLTTAGAGDPFRMMILLSDGLETKTSHPLVRYNNFEVLEPLTDNHIVVFTVALGSDADHGLLEEIARRTGGTYWYVPSATQLSLIYGAIAGRVYGESIVRTASGTVPSGRTMDEKILVDSTIGSTTFSLFWSGSGLDLTLVQPDGSVIDPSVAETDPNVSFVSGGTYQFYKIYNPRAGEWTMRIYGRSTPADGEAYSISVSATSSMDASIKFDKAKYFAGDPVKIEVKIEDTVGDSSEPNYVREAAIKVTVEDPYLNQHSFDLHDDGLHGDDEANDGVYANTFANTSLIGNYNFTIQMSGTDNREGQPFTREYTFSHVLTDPTLRLPNTPILDDFSRRNGKIGQSWSGAKSGYRILDQQVHVRRGGPIYWKPGILAADQQAFFTLTHVDPAGLEQGLLLKVQDNENHRGNWRRGAISVFYNARESKVGIKSCMPHQEWQTLARFDATLQDGDQLGGRAEADGKVRAFVNGVELGSADAGSFFVGEGGRIGVWLADADDAVLDDFGGGGAIAVPVIQSTDDAGPESSVCNYRTNDDNIYFGRCMDGSPIMSGFRFQNVPLPARAAIAEAHLEFTVDGPTADEIAVQILGERSANPETFSDTDRPRDRPLTAALALWAMPATYPWPFNQRRRTPAVTPIVQELVNLPGWKSGNAIAIIVQADPDVPGIVSRRVFGWDRDPSAAARLVVIYTIESLARGDDEEDDDHDDDEADDHDDDR